MKKGVILLIVILLVFTLAGCGKQAAAPTPTPEKKVYKVGVVTGTVSQNEEEYRAGQKMVAKYGAQVIRHVIYPDKFMQEQETTIAQIVSLAADPDLKAIVICQGVPGTAAAIDKVRETRSDIAFLVGVPHEDPELIASRADIVVETDNLKRGETIIALAEKLGARKFIHYSFPRHMSYELLAKRRDIFRTECGKRGIEFLEVDAPDPLGDAGLPGAQQFILEDVPRQIQAHGKSTCFFSTNCGMQEPLIKSVLNAGGIFAEQCCPSPFHAYPNALGVEIPAEKAGNVDYMLDQIKSKVAAAGGSGRFATWRVPGNIAMTIAITEYGVKYANGEVGKQDFAAFTSVMNEAAGGPVTLTPFASAPNFLMFVGDSVIF